MNDHGALPFATEVILFLALAGVLVPLLARWRINQVLGFLAAGCVAGPYGLGAMTALWPELAHVTFTQSQAVENLAELGVVFLMFTIGLELSVERLVSMKRWVFGVGSAQVVMTASVLGGLAWLFGNSGEASVVLGMVLAFSSTAVVMQLLAQRRALGTPMGRGVFSILLLQDLAVVPMLILVNLLGQSGETSFLVSMGMAMGKGLLAIGLIYLIGSRLIRPLFHHLTSPGQSDTFMALTLLSTLGIAMLTWMAGLSLALGAFLAGLLLAETEFRHEVEVTIEPFKGLLMGIFFMSVGMKVDPGALLREPLWLPLSVLGLFAIKSLLAAIALRRGGLPWSGAVEGGLLLGQGGEFAFIVVGAAIAKNLLPPPVGQFMLLVVGLSMFATPLVGRLGSLLGRLLGERPGQTPAVPDTLIPDHLSGHIVIVGFGRIGQLIASVLARQGVPYVAVDSDGATVRRHFDQHSVYFGDASRPELLRRLGVDQASAVVLTMDHTAAAVHTVHSIRREFPDVPVVARARDEEHARTLAEAGASTVVPETLEASLKMATLALHCVGVPHETVNELIDRQRQERGATARP